MQSFVGKSVTEKQQWAKECKAPWFEAFGSALCGFPLQRCALTGRAMIVQMAETMSSCALMVDMQKPP